jgi:hypothetical protein
MRASSGVGRLTVIQIEDALLQLRIFIEVPMYRLARSTQHRQPFCRSPHLGRGFCVKSVKFMPPPVA